jgi:hypothetical protein
MENEKKQYVAWRNYNSPLTKKFDENALTDENALYCTKFQYIVHSEQSGIIQPASGAWG